MIRLPPRSTRTDTLFPYPTLFRSRGPIVPDQRKLLRATPALYPPFRFQCLQSRWELLAPDECHRGVFLCEAGHRAALMLADADVEIVGMSRIEHPAAAVEDVGPEAHS